MAAPSLSDLQTYRARLFDALGNGARVVRDQNGEEIQFRSISEIQRALGIVDSMIADAQRAPPNVILFNTSRFGA